MTPPAATSAARRAPARRGRRRPPAPRGGGPLAARAVADVATRVAPRIPRRVSGPARTRTAPRPRPAAQPLGVRLAAFASTLPDRGLVDRLVRGRAWIAVVGTLLIGLVAMQVSLLRINAGIGGDVERAAALERGNGELRAQVSQLGSGERIQEEAAALGMVLPPAGQISYLRAARGATAAGAANALLQQRFNDPGKAQPLPGEGNGSGAMTSTDGTSTDSTSTSTGSTSSDGTSTDSTSSGSPSSDSSSTSGDSSSTGTSSADGSSGDATAAAAGGTSSDAGATQ